ncbi:MAG: DUF4199 domain-containing protein [Bacteroidota bacterium]
MNQIVRSQGITYGLILGFIFALFTTYGYAIDMSFFTSWWLMLLSFLAMVIVGILAITNSKKLLGGFISFKDAFTAFFITAALGLLISTLIGILIFNVIDPGSKEILKELTIEKTVEVMERFNAPEEALDEALAKIEDTDSFSMGAQFKNYFIALAMYAFIGLIVALIFKKKDPSLIE